VKPKQALLLLTALVFIVSSAILIAQETEVKKEVEKEVGKEDVCEVKVRPTEVKNHYEFEILLTNKEPINAMSFPFYISAGEKKMYYDSVSFEGSRAEFCAVKIPNPDTASQKINLGILTSMTPPIRYIDPGEGRIAKLYFTGDNGVTVNDIVVDTTFFPPSNHLMGVLPDGKTQIYPKFKYTVVEEEKEEEE